MTTIADTIKKAMSTKWYNTPYSHGPVESMAWHLEGYFAERCAGRPCQLEEIDTKMIEEFVTHKQKQHHVTASTINKYLSCLSVLFDVADGIAKSEGLSGVPKPTIKRLPEKRVEKWWMTPDQAADLLEWLGDDTTISREFDTLVALMCFNGLRVKEALSLRWEHVDFDRDWLRVPGTKTSGSEAAIPLDPKVRIYLLLLRDYPLERHLGSSRVLNDMTYERAREDWQVCRKEYLNVEHIPTATLKALRRTFAAYATQAGMPTATLQKVLRHESITTTQGYLRLTGDPALEEARKYMGKPKVLDGGIDGPYNEPCADTIEEAEAARADQIEMLTVALEAYRRTGATPEEVAEFTKALLKG